MRFRPSHGRRHADEEDCGKAEPARTRRLRVPISYFRQAGNLEPRGGGSERRTRDESAHSARTGCRSSRPDRRTGTTRCAARNLKNPLRSAAERKNSQQCERRNRACGRWSISLSASVCRFLCSLRERLAIRCRRRGDEPTVRNTE